ncbi:IS3 family transposase [Photobacterium leiognathi]|uniref:IS3 family transposase n=1 Tax=Photobacterium leiognathi TaxID=553611 RepID=UPI0034E97BED
MIRYNNYIELFYNKRNKHHKLGSISPVQYEASLLNYQWHQWLNDVLFLWLWI